MMGSNDWAHRPPSRLDARGRCKLSSATNTHATMPDRTGGADG